MPGHPWKQWRDGGLPMEHLDLAEILRQTSPWKHKSRRIETEPPSPWDFSFTKIDQCESGSSALSAV